MDYPRYKPKYQRPIGRGAFFDYVLATTRHLESKSLRASAGRKKSLAAAQPQPSAEGAATAKGE